MIRRRKDYLGQERRKYIRLDTVFPVQFKLISPETKVSVSSWLQGFTNNVGKGGICLSVNNLNPESAQLIKNKQVKLYLDIEMPISRSPVGAIARVVWVKDAPDAPNKYLIGLSYDEIDVSGNNKIIRYAWTRKLFFPIVFSLLLVLGLGLGINSFISFKLIRGNKALVEQLVRIIQESSIAKQQVKKINKEKTDLQINIQTLQSRIESIEEEKTNLLKDKELKETEALKKINELNNLIGQLKNEVASSQERLISLQDEENGITEELLRLDKKKSDITKANLDKMYQWLKVHQNPRTGLVMSFEGDSEIANWAFTYDQALVTQAYAYFSDFSRSRKIFDFFDKEAKRIDTRFLNAYYVNDGSPAEYAVHSGPNIWIGIAIMQYTHKTKDRNYLQLAEGLASAIINLQDKDGGIPGGPNLKWYSTEHNLDAYAFFNMLYKITGKSLYLQARDKVLSWLLIHTYDRSEVPIKRGKGDSTIATDTYAWSIAALGPEKLTELGMNPDRIIGFAEENCSVEASFSRPDGQTIKIKGFDFAPARHVARGGVVSSEWTAQMVMAFKIMAEYYYRKGIVAKARSYSLKADEYLAELGNMVISSPSPAGQGEGCLPYATQDFVDTGHGWFTPKGKHTGSVAGTAYTLFAYYNYNPLEIKD